ENSRAVSEQLWQTLVAMLPGFAGIAAARGATAALRACVLVAGQADVKARSEFMLEIVRASGNRFATSIVAGCLGSLLSADAAFLEGALDRLTPQRAGALVAAIGHRDGAEAERILRTVLVPEEAPVGA